MAPSPDKLLQHFREEGYHPRSDKHSNCLSHCLVGDLLTHCPAIRIHAASGELVFDINFSRFTGTAEWNVDLVLGEPAPGNMQTVTPGEIRKAAPSTVRMAIEHKAVMTEHHKAVKNRKRDFEAHHDHVHRYSSSAIAAGVLVVNAARTFKSPLRQDVTVHRDPRGEIVEHCVNQMRAVSERSSPDSSGIDAKAVVVVDMDNQSLKATQYATSAPAPKVGDPMHYDAFLQRLCNLYTERFAP